MNAIFARAGFAVLAFAFIVAPAMPSFAQAADGSPSEAEISGMLAEITKLSAEQKELPKKVETNLTLAKKHVDKLSIINTEIDGANAENAEIEAQRPNVVSLCDRTVPEDQYAAALAQCNAVKIPFEARLDALDKRDKKNNDDLAELSKQEEERVKAYKELQDREKYIQNRLKLLKMSIMLAKRGSCVTKCNNGTEENAAQCLDVCWDLARSDLPGIGSSPRPDFSIAPNRTPEQAIEEYKNSGRERPRVPSGTTVAPPPPPSLE